MSAFVIEGVPAGELELEVWHEAAGRQTRKVTVPAGGELVFDLPLAARTADNP